MFFLGIIVDVVAYKGEFDEIERKLS